MDSELEVYKENGVSIHEKNEAQDVNRIADFMIEISKSYAINGFEPPEDEILLAKANVFAEELSDIPIEWIGRVFTEARRELDPDPKIFHLLQAWRLNVQHRYHASKNIKNKIQPPPIPTGAERLSALRSAFVGCAAMGVKLSSETLQKHSIKQEEILKEKRKIELSNK